MDGAEAAIAREAAGSNLYRWLRGRFYRYRGPAFGFLEALLWSTALDTWHRYAALMGALGERLHPEVRILEVGPGWFGLEFFLPRDLIEAGRLVQLDIMSRPLYPLPGEETRLVGSGIALPAKDDAFDFVVAMDVLEHVPQDLRGSFANEVRRVTRESAFLHMPLESADGTYQAARSDEAFQEWFERRFGRREPNIDEHLAAGHPSLEDVRRQFPEIQVRPTQSVRDWLWYMRAERQASRRAFTGLIRYLQEPSAEPPFYSGLGVWDIG
ncbi:MAG: methyltransferase domain-containing protein [Thermoplasmata archaeon]